jgi:hypothetical protein
VADPGVLGTVASITVGFGITVLFFRIDRELRMHQRGERIWIPWADWLLLSATIGSIVAVLLPLVLFPESRALGVRLPTAGCAASLVSLAGYVLGILAHYRLLFGSRRSGPRHNPEPSERLIVVLTLLAAIGVALISLVTAD